MATTLPNTDMNYLHMIEQAKQDFWKRTSHLPQQQQQQLWLQAASSLPSNVCDANSRPALASQVPRSMAFNPTSTMDLGSMDRTWSAPATTPLERSMSASYYRNAILAQRSFSAIPTYGQSTNDYTLYSEPALSQKPSTLQSIAETSTFTNNAMVEYTPDEYVSNCIKPSSSPSLPTESRQLQLIPNLQWSPSMDGSISPSTPALMTPVTQASSMSRQSSFDPHFLDDISMLRVHSDSSSMFPPLLSSEDGSFSYSVESKTISACADTSHFLTFTGSPSDFSYSPAHHDPRASALESSDNDKAYLVEDMRRSPSSSNESNSSASASSIRSRQSRREREINAVAASRKLAPKALESNDDKSAPSNVSMVRIRSSDGSSKDVGVITKTPYIRPQHPKIMCQYCNERPNGFRGTHELDRHIARAHATVRKGFVCVDASPNKKFLANCKHCRNGKRYGAYYNAAAHLRRAHFHPRKRGPKGKRDEKRGGIGGGDDPPMDYLKQHWIKEVEVVETKPSSSPQDSASDDADNIYDGSYESMDTSYASQVTHEAPMSIDTNQLADMSMFMNSSEPIFDPSTQFANYTEPNNFQFDASYMTQ